MTKEDATLAGSTRKPITYTCDGLELFGVIHRPTACAGPYPDVVMYHGFVAAKYQPPHRIFVQLAERLARAGIGSLRVDLPGRGDSEGESVDITVEGALRAAQSAIDVLATQPDIDPDCIGLLGMSWGGLLAATLAGRDARAKCVALWSCAPREAPKWQPDLSYYGERKAAEVFGNLIGEQFYVGLPLLTPLEDLKKSRASVLLVYGTNDEETSSADVERVQTQLVRADVPVHVTRVEGADHVFFSRPWQQQVVDHTAAWLKQALTSTG